jgi:hypothetical protein
MVADESENALIRKYLSTGGKIVSGKRIREYEVEGSVVAPHHQLKLCPTPRIQIHKGFIPWV